MKRFYLCLMIILLCLGAQSGRAFEDKSVIRVGLPNLRDVSTVLAVDDQRKMIVESLQEISKYTDWRYEFYADREQALFAMLSQGELDMVAGVFERENLAEKFVYPKYLSGYSYALLISQQDDQTVQRNDYRSMQDKRIAAVSYASETKRLISYLLLNDIQSTIIYVDNPAKSLEMLESGEVDMALVDDDDAAGYRVVTRFVVEPYYIIAAPGKEGLIAELNTAYEMILDAEPDYVDNMYTTYLGRATDMTFQLTEAEKAFIGRMPTIRVAVADGFTPLQSFDAEGIARGIGPDVLRHIEEKTGLSFEMTRAASVAEANMMVEAGVVDAALGVSVIDRDGASSSLVLTSPFLIVNRMALSNKHIDYPADGLTIALVPGMDFLMDSDAGDIVYVDSFLDGVAAVNAGEADYTYGSTYLFEYGVESRAFNNIQAMMLPGVSDDLAIGLRRPVSPMLLTILNKAINTVPNEVMQEIVLQNTALRQERRTLLSLIYAYPVVAFVLLAVLTGAIILVTVTFAVLRVRHTRALFNTQFTDEMTGALNLAGFRREAARLLQRSEHFALSYSTIRNFHFVNDRYGYEAGDDVLKQIAAAYRADMMEGEVFCRVSGGTFVALRRYDEQDRLFTRLERFAQQIHSITPQNDPGYHIRMTTGIYLPTPMEQHDNVFGMMDRANIAQQQIITSSEDSYSVYKEGTFDNLMHAQEIESRMETALQHGDFRVYLQPKFDLRTLKPSGAEALVRWFDDGRMIPPGDFIPQFERNGFIARVDRYMFTETCKLLRRWINEDKPIVPISINVSRVQLYSPDFVDSYVAIRDEYQIPDGLLDLEFTESILFEDVERLIETVRRLRSFGFECSIDDFGKGYSSLTMLKNIPADTIKLDAQFFETGIDEQRDTVIIESVIDIAKALEMTTIAEGIETHKQVRMLQMMGCDMAQGYIFSRPIDVASFERYLHQKLIEKRDPYAPLDG